MGGHDDDETSYLVNKQRQDEELKNNKLNDSGLWGDQDTTGNNTKWLKEGQNQLRKVTENQQEQDHNCNITNGNKEDFPRQNTTQEDQQGNEEKTTTSPKTAITTPGLNDEGSKIILNEPLLIDTLESTERKEREEDVKEKEETTGDDEEAANDSTGEKELEEDPSESQRDGGVVGRNACLLFTNVNGAPSDEETNWPALSQDNTNDGSPNGNRGKEKRIWPWPCK